jgi:hypothetical protein
MKLKLTIALAFAALTLSSQAKTLKFNSAGEFKIAQFTDLHINPASAEGCSQTEATIRSIVEQEHPDIAILTGDIVTDDPAIEGWKAVVNLFNDIKIPFTIEMGNHDAEYLTKDEIFDFVMQSPYYVGDKGKAEIFGCGNCTLPVYGADNNVAAVIYCIDSNDYQPNKDLGKYDWIHFDQIEWYRQQSKQYTDANNGSPVPALAFFHIALPEFAELADDPNRFGTQNEGIASPRINSGMFASFVEMGDVMGVFVGHDHDNDYIGTVRNIALGFGRETGADAYGDFVRGARIINLREGKRQFDTYVATPQGREGTYYYPSQLNSVEEKTASYLPAVVAKVGKNGVKYSYYEGRFKHIADLDSSTALKQGTMPYPSIAGAAVDDHFGYVFDALISIAERGIYRFYTYSDDGSVLYIDGNEVVNNDGGHSARRADGKIALEPGLHRIKVKYFEDYMGQELEIGYSSRTITECAIPADILYIEK